MLTILYVRIGDQKRARIFGGNSKTRPKEVEEIPTIDRMDGTVNITEGGVDRLLNDGSRIWVSIGGWGADKRAGRVIRKVKNGWTDAFRAGEHAFFRENAFRRVHN